MSTTTQAENLQQGSPFLADQTWNEEFGCYYIPIIEKNKLSPKDNPLIWESDLQGDPENWYKGVLRFEEEIAKYLPGIIPSDEDKKTIWSDLEYIQNVLKSLLKLIRTTKGCEKSLNWIDGLRKISLTDTLSTRKGILLDTITAICEYYPSICKAFVENKDLVLCNIKIVPSDKITEKEEEPHRKADIEISNFMKLLIQHTELIMKFHSHTKDGSDRSNEDVAKDTFVSLKSAVTALFGYDITKGVAFEPDGFGPWTALDKAINTFTSRFLDANNDKVTLMSIGNVLQMCKLLGMCINPFDTNEEMPTGKSMLMNLLIPTFGGDKLHFDEVTYNELRGTISKWNPHSLEELKFHVMAHLKSPTKVPADFTYWISTH